MKLRQLLSIPALTISLGLLSACGTKIQNQNDVPFSTEIPQIVGGEFVAADEQIAKSTVALSHPLYGVFCTGTLIGKNLVLTAAHCTRKMAQDPRSLSVIFSRFPPDASATEIRKILGGRVHENWARSTPQQYTNLGDVVVLRFEGVAPAGYEPVSILGNAGVLKDGMDVVLAGYGLSSMSPVFDPQQLLKANVKLSDANYSEMEVSFLPYEGRSSCHGDSGGPAFIFIKGKLVLVGVTSQALTDNGTQTCLEGSSSTSTAAIKSFLVEAAKSLNSPDFVPGQPIPQPKISN